MGEISLPPSSELSTELILLAHNGWNFPSSFEHNSTTTSWNYPWPQTNESASSVLQTLLIELKDISTSFLRMVHQTVFLLAQIGWSFPSSFDHNSGTTNGIPSKPCLCWCPYLTDPTYRCLEENFQYSFFNMSALFEMAHIKTKLFLSATTRWPPIGFLPKHCQMKARLQ